MKRMALFLLISAIIFALAEAPGLTQALDQRIATTGEKSGVPIRFRFVEKLEFDFIRRPIKLLITQDKIYILDWMLSQVFVIDPNGHVLDKIGRPGQGPGDLERPIDMALSPDGSLYVLNAGSRRIEVFSKAGAPMKRIVLAPPRDLIYSNPDRLLILPGEKLLVGYSFSPHLLDVYGPDGKFFAEWLRREFPINPSGKNIGNALDILPMNPSGFLMLNRFTGVFQTIDPAGNRITEFSAYSRIHADNVRRVIDSIKGSPKTSGIQVDTVYQWSTACRDTNGDVLVFSLFEKEDEAQNLFAFSQDGILRYRTTVPQFRGMSVIQLYSSDDRFYFITADDEIFFAVREVHP
jgi:hypothetical protein